RSDVFSLGTMLYQMICGALPWSREHQVRMAWGLAQNAPPTPLARYRPGVPPELEALVARTLAWKPDERPTARELADSLDPMGGALEDGPADRVQQPPSEVERPAQTPPPAEAEAITNWLRLLGSRG